MPGPWPGPTHVSGEWRAPATSQHPIRTGNDAGTTRRALLAPLPFALPSSLLAAARRRVLFTILSWPHEADLLIPLRVYFGPSL